MLYFSLIAIANLACSGSCVEIIVLRVTFQCFRCQHRTFSRLPCASFVKPVLVVCSFFKDVCFTNLCSFFKDVGCFTDCHGKFGMCWIRYSNKCDICYISVLPCQHRTFSCLCIFCETCVSFKKDVYKLPLLILHVLDPLFWLWYVTFQCLRNVPAVSTNKNKERKRKKGNPFPCLPLFVLISLCCSSCTLKSNVFQIWVETGLIVWMICRHPFVVFVNLWCLLT